MTDRTLSDLRILVVEDEYLLATELQSELADAGAVVVGPVGAIEDALELIAATAEIDAAVLDANLQGEMVFPVAEKLEERGIPYLFTTGYDASIVAGRFEHIERIEKPLSMAKLRRAIGLLVQAS